MKRTIRLPGIISLFTVLFLITGILYSPQVTNAQETPSNQFNSSPMLDEFTFAFESAAMGNLRFVNRDYYRELLYQPGMLNERRGLEVLTGVRSRQQRRILSYETADIESITGTQLTVRNAEWFIPIGFVIQNEDAHFVMLTGYSGNRYRQTNRGIGQNDFFGYNHAERNGFPLQVNFTFRMSNRFSGGVSFSGSFLERELDFSYGPDSQNQFQSFQENSAEYSTGFQYIHGVHRIYAKSTFYIFRIRSRRGDIHNDELHRFYRGINTELQWHYQIASTTMLAVRGGYMSGALQSNAYGPAITDTGEEETTTSWQGGIGISHQIGTKTSLFAEADYFPATIRDGDDRIIISPNAFDDTYRQWAFRVGNQYELSERFTLLNGLMVAGHRTRFERELSHSPAMRNEKNTQIENRMLVSAGLSFNHKNFNIIGYSNYNLDIGSPIRESVLQANLPSLSAGITISMIL